MLAYPVAVTERNRGRNIKKSRVETPPPNPGSPPPAPPGLFGAKKFSARSWSSSDLLVARDPGGGQTHDGHARKHVTFRRALRLVSRALMLDGGARYQRAKDASSIRITRVSSVVGFSLSSDCKRRLTAAGLFSDVSQGGRGDRVLFSRYSGILGRGSWTFLERPMKGRRWIPRSGPEDGQGLYRMLRAARTWKRWPGAKEI